MRSQLIIVPQPISAPSRDEYTRANGYTYSFKYLATVPRALYERRPILESSRGFCLLCSRFSRAHRYAPGENISSFSLSCHKYKDIYDTASSHFLQPDLSSSGSLTRSCCYSLCVCVSHGITLLSPLIYHSFLHSARRYSLSCYVDAILLDYELASRDYSFCRRFYSRFYFLNHSLAKI